MERGKTKGKVMILKERKCQSHDKYNKVRYCDDKYLDIYNIAVERVHCDKCKKNTFNFISHRSISLHKVSHVFSEKNFIFDFRQFCCK